MTKNIQELKYVRIKELSTSIVTTNNDQSKKRYSYIELSDGTMLKNVEVQTALTAKIESALTDGTPIDIHIMRVSKNELVILAVRASDGRLFASNIPKFTLWLMISPLILVLAGFPLLLFFGLGLLVWWLAWITTKNIWTLHKMGNYVRSLPDAILLD